MRKSFDGLSAIITGAFKKDPIADGIFVFVNRSRNQMKLLVWDRHGYWILFKRLEEGRFQMPPDDCTGTDAQTLRISMEQLMFIIEGIDLSSIKRRKRYQLSPS
jgi:transposase